MIIGVCSGYFRLIHTGHLEYLAAANSRCDKLIVIINNDVQMKLKGVNSPFTQSQRLVLVQAIKSVDVAMLSIDTDLSVCDTLRQIKAMHSNNKVIFFNDGDVADVSQIREASLCEDLDIEICLLGHSKVDSSTDVETRMLTQNSPINV